MVVRALVCRRHGSHSAASGPPQAPGAILPASRPHPPWALVQDPISLPAQRRPALTFSVGGGLETLTSDASDWAGSVWWDNIRLHHTFTQEQLDGPYGSSTNPRELFMVPMNISQLGPRLRGRIMLLRLDNTAAVGATIKVASSSPEVLRLLWWLVELLQFYDIEIVARHLPGRDNTPADAISRLKGLRDNQDWQILRQIFERLAALVGPFAVDACADPLGRNAYCTVYWSTIDKCLADDWADQHIYCNPPSAAIKNILMRHIWTCYTRRPHSTSTTFVSPTWFTANWWRLAAGGQVVGFFERGHVLFTSAPNWHTASRPDPVPTRRTYKGPTKQWGVVLIIFPADSPMNRCRGDSPELADLPRMSGNKTRDELLLRVSCGAAPCHQCGGRPDTGTPELYICSFCEVPGVSPEHRPEWERMHAGAELLSLRLAPSSQNTYAASMRRYCPLLRGRVPAHCQCLPANCGPTYSTAPRTSS